MCVNTYRHTKYTCEYIAAVASIGIQSGISSISEDVGTINVCVEINGLETQELETDIIVDLNVEDITTGMPISIPYHIQLHVYDL